ncbi:hypothetical protein [Streptomyces sp. NPDC008150]|uniref:hypothetical protein n=1 Tax=Streptomyces sp. NPDC008150 TaxID=3364816 RepID=UPI0036EE38C5
MPERCRGRRAEIAARMAHTLGRPVTYVPVQLDEFRHTLERRGLSPHKVQHLVAVAVDYRDGIFAGSNDLVRTIGGEEPLGVEAFVEKNRAFYETHTA